MVVTILSMVLILDTGHEGRSMKDTYLTWSWWSKGQIGQRKFEGKTFAEPMPYNIRTVYKVD